MERAAEHGIATYALPPLTDIDHLPDYEAALVGPLGRRLEKLVKRYGS